MNENKYFAKLDTEEIGNAIIEKVEDYYEYLSTEQMNTLWRECYTMYYNGYYSKGYIEKTGRQNNKRYMNVNVQYLANLKEIFGSKRITYTITL